MSTQPAPQAADAGRAFELSDLLDRHLPDMVDGFVILTSYGQIRIAPGRLADNIRDLLAQDARLELMRIEIRRQPQTACITPTQLVDAVDRMVHEYNAPRHRPLPTRADGNPLTPDDVWAGGQA